jgi:CDP-4-dehydro-6-deoxyglucose reductase
MAPVYPQTAEKRFEVSVLDIEPMNPSVVRLRLRQHPEFVMRYRAGQFLSIELPDGDLRSYSMASAEPRAGVIELHIRLHDEGKFSRLLRDGLTAGDLLTLQGPFGDCVWQPPLSDTAHVVLLATGTGIAPLNALVEAALQSGCTNPLWLYWGCRTADELYLAGHFDELAGRHPNFHFIPVLSDADAAWTGERGFVQNVAGLRHVDLSGAHVYACGSPWMVSAARALLTGVNGLAPERFFADSFEAAYVGTEVGTEVSTDTGTEAGTDAADPATQVHVPVVIAKEGVDARQTLDLRAGETLMSTLREARLIQGVCGGKRSCGTCRVTVEPSWFARLKPAERGESRLLQALDPCGPFDRLACQIMLEPSLAGLQVTLPRTPF